MKDKNDVVEFDFQEIAINDIPKYLPETYRSNYAAFRALLIERVNQMDSEKTLIFAPTKKMTTSIGKLSDDKIARICWGVNHSFVHARMNWKIAYSEKNKVFVLKPYQRKGGITPKHKIQSNGNGDVPLAVESAQSGFKEDDTQRMHKLVRLMKDKLGVTLRQLQEKRNPETIDYKRAMLYVGRNGLGLKLADLGNLLGISSGSATSLCQQALTVPSAKEKVDVLVAALNK